MNFFEAIQRFCYKLRNDKRYKYYDLLVKNMALTSKQMVVLQNGLIKKLIEHAYEQTVFYRNAMDNLGLTPDDIKTREDLVKMPVLTKRDILANSEKLKSNDSYGKKLIRVTSGGSTGKQVAIYKSPYFIQMSRAAALRNNLLANWRPCDKTIWIWGAPYENQQLKSSFAAKFCILINRRLLFNAYKYSKDQFPYWANKIRKYKPKVIYGYASILYDFAKYLIDNEIHLKSVHSVVSTTEQLRGRDVIERGFRCKVYDQYGSREVLAIGIENGDNVMCVADDVVAMTHTDSGEILLTALHSYGFPLINYAIGDSGRFCEVRVSDDSVPFSKFNLTIGRVTDNFLTKQGNEVSTSALGAFLSTLKFNILEHQLIQNDYEQFLVRYVPADGFNFSLYEKGMSDVFKKYFGDESEIEFEVVDAIPVEKSGKKMMAKRTFELEAVYS